MSTSDRLGAYNGISPPRRQLGWAHLIRDFVDWRSYGGVAERIAQGAERCAQDLFRYWHGYRRGEYDQATLQRGLEPIQEKLRGRFEEGSRCGVSRVQKNCKQLLALWPALWTFAHQAKVEPTNNAERTLRAGGDLAKDQLRFAERPELASGGAFLTVAETCKKQRKSLLRYLTALIVAHRSGHAALRLLPTP